MGEGPGWRLVLVSPGGGTRMKERVWQYLKHVTITEQSQLPISEIFCTPIFHTRLYRSIHCTKGTRAKKMSVLVVYSVL